MSPRRSSSRVKKRSRILVRHYCPRCGVAVMHFIASLKDYYAFRNLASRIERYEAEGSPRGPVKTLWDLFARRRVPVGVVRTLESEVEELRDRLEKLAHSLELLKEVR